MSESTPEVNTINGNGQDQDINITTGTNIKESKTKPSKDSENKLLNERMTKLKDLMVQSYKISDIPINTGDVSTILELPDYIKENKENAKLSAMKASCDPNFRFPVSDKFDPIIKSFLQSSEITSVLQDAHHSFILLLLYPEIDDLFCKKVFSQKYLDTNFNFEEFLKLFGSTNTTGESSNNAENTQNLGVEDYTESSSSNATNDSLCVSEQIPPLSVQLHDSNIPAHVRLMKFIFSDSLPDDLRAGKVTKELTYEEFAQFIKTTEKYYNWMTPVKQYHKFLFKCDRSGTNGSCTETKKIGCEANIKIKFIDEKYLEMEWSPRHNHSFFDKKSTVSDSIRKAARNWLDFQIIIKKEWSQVQNLLPRLRFYTNIKVLDQNLKMDYSFFINRKRAIEKQKYQLSSSLHPSLQQWETNLCQKGFANYTTRDGWWSFAFSLEDQLKKLLDFGQVIFLDSTHKVAKGFKMNNKQENVFLYTIIVLHQDTKQGTPVAFLLTNSERADPLETFLRDLRGTGKFNPQICCIDCSATETSVIKKVFADKKDLKIQYCFFHLNRAIQKRVESHITIDKYVSNNELLVKKGLLSTESRDNINCQVTEECEATDTLLEQEISKLIEELQNNGEFAEDENDLDLPLESFIRDSQFINLVENQETTHAINPDLQNFSFLDSTTVEYLNNPPKDHSDILKIRRLAIEKFHEIMNSSTKTDSLNKIEIYKKAFNKYPYWIAYFNYWLSRKDCWLRSYSSYHDSTHLTNNYIESYHRVFKEKFLKGSSKLRVDTVIGILSEAVVSYYVHKEATAFADFTNGKENSARTKHKEKVDKISEQTIVDMVSVINDSSYKVIDNDKEFNVTLKRQCYHCDCDSYGPINYCEHIYIVRRFESFNADRRIKKRRFQEVSKAPTEANTYIRYLLQNSNSENILETTTDVGPVLIGPLSGECRYIEAQSHLDDRNWSLPMGKVSPNLSVNEEADGNINDDYGDEDDGSFDFFSEENNADMQTAWNTFLKAYNNNKSKLNNDEKLEVTKKVCNALYDEANRLNGNSSNKQVRHRYAAKGKKKRKTSK
ncbi:conserved hypothetical protein [Candida dubliniensis CD36]|uniref:SWIM-type domain-containing protein n=1 Tax=Candida dubliniensis (strain CD36 / ATCC MYA-646 / CBS 7987 / NCPF 3949 / NRRL Y-17841) TaxID=573826 RepID=B9WCP4_CANDC|nr:conserved hypothetical protein [Candida dubliniensis CD36]CAX44167.1 conserved hypothetical protein [Candida dubliniensis CD36]